MSKTEILAELPRLSAPERAEILDCLWHLQEAAGPTVRETTLLNEAQAKYDANPSDGAPWRDVEARLAAGGATAPRRSWRATRRASTFSG